MNPIQSDPLVLNRIKNNTSRLSGLPEIIPLINNSKKRVENLNMRIERILLSRLKTGDKTAFSMIFDAYYSDCVFFAISFTHNQDSAEEIVQDTFVKLWIEHDSIRINQSLKSYLLTIVRNKCIDLYRHNMIKTTHADIISHGSPYYEYETDNYLLYSELQEQLESALNKLPDEISLPFKMNRNQGLKYNEIAVVLGVSVRTIEVRIGKALHMLRDYLKEYFISIMIFVFMFFR